MSTQSDIIEKIFDQYDDVLYEIGIKYIGVAYFNEGWQQKVPLILKDGNSHVVDVYIDIDTYKKIEEDEINHDNLILIGNRVYDKTEFVQTKKTADEDKVSWPDYFYDMYYSKWLVLESRLLHALFPEISQKIWNTIGKQYNLNSEQSNVLRMVCYRDEPDYAVSDYLEDYIDANAADFVTDKNKESFKEDPDGFKYEISEEIDLNNDDEFKDSWEEAKKYNIVPLIEKLREYSLHYKCEPNNCKVDGSNVKKCQELRDLFGGLVF